MLTALTGTGNGTMSIKSDMTSKYRPFAVLVPFKQHMADDCLQETFKLIIR